MSAALGLVCTLLSVGLVWPQVLKVHRAGSVEGLAPGGTLHGLAACTLWSLYGLAVGLPPVVVSNVAIGLALSMIAAAQVRHGTLPVPWLAAAVGGALGLGLAGLAVSPGATGWVAIVVGVTAILPQTLHVARSDALAGVSLTMYGLLLTSTVLWSAYGVLVGDGLVVLTNVLVAPCALYVATRAWRAQHGSAATRTAAAEPS